jgi:putative FmdB family regulatory protein
MPSFEFECLYCNLRFERTLKMADHPTHPCPKCECDAPRVWNGFAFGFGGAPGETPGNTGVHDKDYPTADKAVGRSAEARWGEFTERAKVKEQARAQGGTHALMRRNGADYVEYEPLSDTGLEAHRKLAHEAVDVLKGEQ